jgi:UDP-2,4-diacetamido-2,4,6-trideoxy-beta-L-altropyranose hydrolase
MKVAFITELLQASGMGHYTRCHSLADAFYERNMTPVFFLMTDHPNPPKNADYNYFHINWQSNPEQLLNELNDFQMAVLDSYHADSSLINMLCEKLSIPVFFDDENKIKYPKGIVINGNFFAAKLNYSPSDDLHCLLGIHFQPLRKEFWTGTERNYSQNLTKLLITVGGSDQSSFINDLSKALVEKFPDIFLHILSPKGTSYERTQLHWGLTALQMKHLMETCDAAVSAAGQTTFELAATQTPSVLIKIAENQQLNIESWTEPGIFDYAGDLQDATIVEKVVSGVEKLRNNQYRNSKITLLKNNLSTLGSRNCTKAILIQAAQRFLKLRKATDDDVYLLYDLSNDPEVRRLSFNSAPIPMENHRLWFNDKLKSPSTLFLVIELLGEFAGQVRYETEGDKAVVGISIRPDFRGIGLAEKSLRQSAIILKKYFPDIKIIEAYIKHENIASVKSFEKAGYRLVDENDCVYHSYKFEFHYYDI